MALMKPVKGKTEQWMARLEKPLAKALLMEQAKALVTQLQGMARLMVVRMERAKAPQAAPLLRVGT